MSKERCRKIRRAGSRAYYLTRNEVAYLRDLIRLNLTGVRPHGKELGSYIRYELFRILGGDVSDIGGQ